MLFYESGRGSGRSGIFATGRVVRSSLIVKSSVPSNVRRRGVVEEGALFQLSKSERLAVTTFDNIMLLKTPVGFQRLREIGCVDRSNLVTARRVSHEHMILILKEGQPNG